MELKFKKLKNELSKLASFKLKFSNFNKMLNNIRLQTLISLGDISVSNVLINYYLYGADFGALRRALNESKFSIDKYLLKIKECYTPWKI